MRWVCSPNFLVLLRLVDTHLRRNDKAKNAKAREQYEEVEQNVSHYISLLVKWQLRKEEPEFHASNRCNSTDPPDPEPQLEYGEASKKQKIHQLEVPACARSWIHGGIHPRLTPSEQLPEERRDKIKVASKR